MQRPGSPLAILSVVKLVMVASVRALAKYECLVIDTTGPERDVNAHSSNHFSRPSTHHATYIIPIDFQRKKGTARNVTYISGGVFRAHTAP
jgi:hypothetical protein